MDQFLTNYSKELKKEGIVLDLEEEGPGILIHIIDVPLEKKGQGLGSIVMNKLCEWADKTNTILHLSPAGSHINSRKWLIGWYSQFGFIENKGEDNRDDLHYMYRLPRSKQKVKNLIKGDNINYDPVGLLVDLKNIKVVCELCKSDVSLFDKYCLNCGKLFDQELTLEGLQNELNRGKVLVKYDRYFISNAKGYGKLVKMVEKQYIGENLPEKIVQGDICFVDISGRNHAYEILNQARCGSLLKEDEITDWDII